MYKKSLLVAGAIATIGLGSLAGLHAANAASPIARTSLIDQLVAKFHLNKADVQAVFTANRQTTLADRGQMMKDRLAQAVTAGKLTQAQADAITAKQADVKTFMESLKGKTPADRKTAIAQEQTDLTAWAKDNNIPAQFAHIAGPMMRGGHKGFGPQK